VTDNIDSPRIFGHQFTPDIQKSADTDIQRTNPADEGSRYQSRVRGYFRDYWTTNPE
jgi:hypothetical protein